MESFRYKCYRNLFKTFGRVDATVELIELSIRELAKKAKGEDRPEEYIANRAKENDIKVNTFCIDELNLRASQLHILNVFQQFEEYLITLTKEANISIKKEGPKKESLFIDLIRTLNNNDKPKVSPIEISIIEYYRGMKNIFIHPDIDRKKQNSKLKNIQEKISDDNKLKKYNAPNEYSKLCFDDFILYTKVTKDVAQKLCVLSRPKDTDIIKLIKDSKHYNKTKKYKNNPERHRKALQTLCRCEYSININDSLAIIEELLTE